MHGAFVKFMAWAARYDTGGLDLRSRARHEGWLAAHARRVLRLDSREPIDALVERVVAELYP